MADLAFDRSAWETREGASFGASWKQAGEGLPGGLCEELAAASDHGYQEAESVACFQRRRRELIDAFQLVQSARRIAEPYGQFNREAARQEARLYAVFLAYVHVQGPPAFDKVLLETYLDAIGLHLEEIYREKIRCVVRKGARRRSLVPVGKVKMLGLYLVERMAQFIERLPAERARPSVLLDCEECPPGILRLSVLFSQDFDGFLDDSRSAGLCGLTLAQMGGREELQGAEDGRSLLAVEFPLDE